ncbi:MAG: hypothetical protein AAGB07_19170, partial [Pseudomonadota bacterium]
ALKSFSEADYVSLQSSAQPILDKWLADADATGLDGQAIMGEMLSLIKKWNDVEETQGLPWERS